MIENFDVTNVQQPAPTSAAADEIPPGTRRVAQVVQSFAYENLWITTASPRSEVEKVPADVLEQHAATGFVRFVNEPIPAKE
jgi:hypothetical protein